MATTRRETPPRSTVQRMDALQRANQVRAKRAKLKKDLKRRRESVDGYILAPPDYVKTMKIIDLVMAAPKIGRVKAYKVLQKTRISPSKTIAGLTDRQRSEIVTLLRES